MAAQELSHPRASDLPLFPRRRGRHIFPVVVRPARCEPVGNVSAESTACCCCEESAFCGLPEAPVPKLARGARHENSHTYEADEIPRKNKNRTRSGPAQQQADSD